MTSIPFVSTFERGSLVDEYIATWYHTVSSGTSGTVTIPSGGTIVLNRFAEAGDALATTLNGSGDPKWQTPQTAGGADITATLDGDGNYTLSGTPSSYPIGIIFTYRVSGDNYDLTKDFNAAPFLGDGVGANGSRIENVYTAGENVSAGDIVYMAADGKIYQADASGTLAQATPFGVAQTTTTTNNTTAVTLHGLGAHFSALTTGTTYYLGTTAGALTNTAPTGSGEKVVIVGAATASNTLDFDPQFIVVRD
jgi:hypothetical protein